MSTSRQNFRRSSSPPTTSTPSRSSQYSSHSTQPPNSSANSPLTDTSPAIAGGDDDDRYYNSNPSPRPPPTSKSTQKSSREDVWSHDATHTLIEAWGDRYLELKRGHLRQKHWQEVAAAVNFSHAHTASLRRTDIQCKNRMDTVKKKYKIEKSRVSNSRGKYKSRWPFFARLDSLIGVSFKPSPPAAAVATRRRTPALPPPPSSFPVAPRSKRHPPLPSPVVQSAASGRKFAAMTAAAAAKAEEESYTLRRCYRDNSPEDGFRQIAVAIEKFGEIYERVEREKLAQMIELEKHRLQFATDLDIQRMKLFTESQIQLERIEHGLKRPNRT